MAGHFLYLKIIKIRILLKTWFDIDGNIADFLSRGTINISWLKSLTALLGFL